MKKLLILVMACYALTARSQEGGSKNLVYLYSDSIIHAQDVSLQHNYSGTLTIRADGRRIPIEQVKFFSNEDGYFANTQRITIFNIPGLAERVLPGKISLFREVDFDPVSFDYHYMHYNRFGYAGVDRRMFYNKNFSDLKRISYHNLSQDMAEHPVSMEYLKQYRKNMRIGTAMYVGAGAAFVAAAISLFSNSGFKDSSSGFGQMSRPNFGESSFRGDNKTGSFILFGLGAGLGLGGVLIQKSGARSIDRAIDAYNR